METRICECPPVLARRSRFCVRAQPHAQAGCEVAGRRRRNPLPRCCLQFENSILRATTRLEAIWSACRTGLKCVRVPSQVNVDYFDYHTKGRNMILSTAFSVPFVPFLSFPVPFAKVYTRARLSHDKGSWLNRFVRSPVRARSTSRRAHTGFGFLVSGFGFHV